MKKLIIGGIVIIGVAVLLFFQKTKVHNDYSKLTEQQTKKFKRMYNQLQGKKLSSISEILGDSIIFNGQNIVFYYNPGDCGSCIKKGQRIVRRFNARLKSHQVYIISARMLQDSLKKRFLGTNAIYLDQQNKFMRESGFTYTPLFLLLDHNAKVIDLLQVLSGINDTAAVNSFISHSFNKLQNHSQR